jgi:hypothetical protein
MSNTDSEKTSILNLLHSILGGKNIITASWKKQTYTWVGGMVEVKL